MAIQVKLDQVLAKQKMPLKELSERVGVSMKNLSLLKQGHVRAIRFSTLNGICSVLNCKPGDILDFEEDFENEPKA